MLISNPFPWYLVTAKVPPRNSSLSVLFGGGVNAGRNLDCCPNPSEYLNIGKNRFDWNSQVEVTRYGFGTVRYRNGNGSECSRIGLHQRREAGGVRCVASQQLGISAAGGQGRNQEVVTAYRVFGQSCKKLL
jgi:hypothetical protein